MKVGLSISLSIVALLGVAGSAIAQTPTPPTPEQRAARFVAADSDKDGELSKIEFVAALPERAKARADQLWPIVDKNNDGNLTKEEFLAMPMGRAGRAQ